jgi:hypothetical protein
VIILIFLSQADQGIGQEVLYKGANDQDQEPLQKKKRKNLTLSQVASLQNFKTKSMVKFLNLQNQ